jgi:CRP-like cAMP-binding protein
MLVKNLLTKVPIFHGLKVSEMRRFLEICKMDTVPQGQTVCQYGEPSKQFFILLEGTLELLSRDGTKLTELKPVQTMGEMGLITKRPRAATVRAHTPVRLLEMSFTRFEAFLDTDPDLRIRLYRNFIRVLAERLNDTNDMVARYKRLYEDATQIVGGESDDDVLPDDDEPMAPPAEMEEGEAGGESAVPTVGAAREHVVAFYELVDRLPEEDDLGKGASIVAELHGQGFSDADIEYAVRWTARHIPGAQRFDMVQLSIQEALEDKWSI